MPQLSSTSLYASGVLFVSTVSMLHIFHLINASNFIPYFSTGGSQSKRLKFSLDEPPGEQSAEFLVKQVY